MTSFSYLVCATHRSGSSLLCQSLWHSGIAGYPQEFFSPTQSQKIAREFELTCNPDEDFPNYIAAIQEKRATPNGVFGAKVMWAHLSGFAAKLGLPENSPRELFKRWNDCFPNLQLVWARRDDKIRQAISLWKAKQTNIYNSLQIGKREKAREEPRFDFEEIRKIRNRFEQEDASWAKFFEQIGVTPFEVHYETFAQKHEEMTRELLQNMGVNVPQGLKFQPITYQQQSDSINDEWYQRFQKLDPKN